MGKQSMYGRIGVVLNRVPVGLGPPPPNCPVTKVMDLLKVGSRRWNTELIGSLFRGSIGNQILTSEYPFCGRIVRCKQCGNTV